MQRIQYILTKYSDTVNAFDCEKYKNYQLDYFHLPSQGATRRKMDGGGVSGGKGEWLIVWRGSVEGVGSLAPSKKSTCQIPNNLLNLSTSLRPEPDKESRDLYSQQLTLSRKDYIFMQYHPWCMFIQNWSGLPTKCIQTVKEVVRCRGQTKGLGSTGASEKTYQGFWKPLPLCEKNWYGIHIQSRVAEVARMRKGPSLKSLDSDENFKA